MLKKYERWLVFSFFIVLFLIIYFVTNYQDRRRVAKILKHAAYTEAQFTGEVHPVKKGSNGPWYVCSYHVKGKDYSSSEPVHLFDDFNMKFFYKTFPVIYDSTNPEDEQLLLFPFEFEEFNLPYPDSLKMRMKY